MISQGQKNKLGYIDFLVKATVAGEVSCRIYTDYHVDEDDDNADYDSAVNNSTGDTFFNQKFLTQPSQFESATKNRLWKRFYCPVDAQFFEYLLTFDDTQMSNRDVVNSSVWIDSFIIWSERGGRLAE